MQLRTQKEKIGQKYFLLNGIFVGSLLRPYLFLGLVLNTFFGCQSVPHETRAPAIVNGQVTELAKNSGLVLQIIEGEKHSRCSASFVDLGFQNVIVTAAHCLWAVDQKKARANVFRVKTEDNKVYLEKIGSIVDQAIRKGYQAKDRNIEDPYDLALGLLDQDIPSDMKKLSLPVQSWLPRNAEAMRLMGAGLTILEFELDKTSAMMRTALIQGEYLVRRGTLFGSLWDLVSSSGFKEGDTLTIRKPQDKGPYLCPGDSGGALIAEENGNHTIVGVISTENQISYYGRKVCWYPVNLVPVSAHLKWLKDTAQELVELQARKKSKSL